MKHKHTIVIHVQLYKQNTDYTLKNNFEQPLYEIEINTRQFTRMEQHREQHLCISLGMIL
jgi:hypothetical protein